MLVPDIKHSASYLVDKPKIPSILKEPEQTVDIETTFKDRKELLKAITIKHDLADGFLDYFKNKFVKAKPQTKNLAAELDETYYLKIKTKTSITDTNWNIYEYETEIYQAINHVDKKQSGLLNIDELKIFLHVYCQKSIFLQTFWRRIRLSVV